MNKLFLSCHRDTRLRNVRIPSLENEKMTMVAAPIVGPHETKKII